MKKTNDFKPIKIIEVELTKPIEDIEGLEKFEKLQVLVRMYNIPIGYIHLPVLNSRCSSAMLSLHIIEQYHYQIVQLLIQNGITALIQNNELQISDLLNLPPQAFEYPSALVTVAVCTRDRTEDLALCLEALCQLDYPHLELMVVDNAPTTTATELLVKNHYPAVRYVQEPRPGLSWARNRAIVEASGEIIAYTDDDVIVDAGWVRALAGVFAENPEAMAVTGLVVPYELETEAQVLFERHGGFGKGFQRKSWHVSGNKVPWQLLGAGQFGTGANMAFRRHIFNKVGLFNPALGAGTVTHGGEDLEMFFKTLKHGYMLVYEPCAIVRHRHRRDYLSLRSQLKSDGIGLYSYFKSGLSAFPIQRKGFLKLGLWWLMKGNLKPLWISYKQPVQFPRDLIIAELKGCFSGMNRYPKACRIASEIEQTFGSIPLKEIKDTISDEFKQRNRNSVSVQIIELSEPVPQFHERETSSVIQLYVTWKQRLIGSIQINNPKEVANQKELYKAITNVLYLNLLQSNYPLDKNFLWAEITTTLMNHYSANHSMQGNVIGLPGELPVSIVVATYDRPEDLRQCLHSLKAQKTKRPVEIIVVDNHPSSGLTAPVVAEFSNIILIEEQRQGLSYARNAGFTASSGAICVATDDDVTMPSDWLERLLVPFTRPEVMVVTGNVLPMELESPSQRLFESYGGLGRGFENKEVNGKWFEACRHAVPTWQLGATANAAFRSTIFSHPAIGLLEESLGAGMPSGVGEDTYMFYKVLKAGYTICYQADAYVWHKHRSTMKALKKQIFHYSMGHVAYHLHTWLHDKDKRALIRIFYELPQIHLKRLATSLNGRSQFPISIILLEIAGNMLGPWAFYRSLRRVKRFGRSACYIPSSEIIDK